MVAPELVALPLPDVVALVLEPLMVLDEEEAPVCPPLPVPFFPPPHAATNAASAMSARPPRRVLKLDMVDHVIWKREGRLQKRNAPAREALVPARADPDLVPRLSLDRSVAAL